MLAFYDHLLSRDEAGRWWFEALWSNEQSEHLESRLSEWRRRAAEPEAQAGRFACGRFVLRPEPEIHLVSVARAIEHIRSGDVFQVNVCARLEAEFFGDPLELFCAGAGRLAPRYGAFLGQPSLAVASFSPELFLKRQHREVLSSPIKGTARRRGSSLHERRQLLASDKDRAENLMIVDLVRNDLGRVCRYGSVAVSELFRAEEHPGVWHLVSDVTGELSNETSDADLVRAAFPPGSVTGAPKVKAMELVTALEATEREVYTGAIGIASPLSGLELNVAIRTFELARGKAWLGVGGGVVADSDPNGELEECFDKARPLLAAVDAELEGRPQARSGARWRATSENALGPAAFGAGVFETVLVIDGRPVELESHLGRLAASVSCLYGSRPSPRLGAEVMKRAKSLAGPHRLRVLVRPRPGGGLKSEVTVSPAPEAFSGSPGLGVTLIPTVLSGGLGRHKWYDRVVLAERRETLRLGRGQRLLLLDDDGAVLEAEHANVFAVFGDVLRTPPLDGHILAGTTRDLLMRVAAGEGFEVVEEPFTLSEIAAAEEAFLTSSIAGLCAVDELLGSRSFGPGAVTARLAKAVWASWTFVHGRNA